MEIRERYRSFSRAPAHDDIGVQGSECHRHVGGIGGDAGVGPSEDRVVAIEAVEGGATGAGPPLVAGEIILVTEVSAAGALHNVSTHRRHVSELAGCGEQ